jgi:hypothetical protein
MKSPFLAALAARFAAQLGAIPKADRLRLI